MTRHSEKPVSFAIVGCGAIGRKRLASLSTGQLVIACDLDPGRAERLARDAGGGARATTDPTEAIHDAMVDAVIVSTPNSSLATIAAIALEARKPVLVEKPGAISESRVNELISLSEKHAVPVRVGFNHRFHPALIRAREMVDSGALGALMFVRARYGHGGRIGYDREWRADPELSGGGELIDQGVHLIDLAGWFLGDFTIVEGHAGAYFWDMPVDDNAFLSLRTSDGRVAWLHASCSEWKNTFSFEIYGRDGKLHIEGLGGSYGVERLSFYKMLPEMGPPETTIWEFPGGDDSWRLEMRAFLDDVRERRTPSPGLREARSALRIVERIYALSGYSFSSK